MSMLDSFFNKGFKGAKGKTLLKLTIPRIKLLRNRREIQIKQMRRDIAKLLETGQEATARIRVEHIIREQNMMGAQEILELFCELIAVRIPIIETQRECPLDLKEAISSVCFAAPRCADLPELQQVQMLFASKYGKEFVSAATELMPNCGVNRQLIELLSIRAPPAEVKLKLLKEIAEEHELDWDPAASETELFKPHEDLLNGPTQFVSGSNLPLPKEKHDESLYSAPVEVSHEESDSDSDLDSLDLPEVPKVSLNHNFDCGSAPVVVPPPAPRLSGQEDESTTFYEAPVVVPPPAPHLSGQEDESTTFYEDSDYISHESYSILDAVTQGPLVASLSDVNQEPLVASSTGLANTLICQRGDKQFLPFISPPPLSSASFSLGQNDHVPTSLRAKNEVDTDLQDVLAAAQAAAESAERAAAAARSAASLAQVRITELIKKKNDVTLENSGYASDSTSPTQSATLQTPQLDHQQSFGNTDINSYTLGSHTDHGSNRGLETLNCPSFDTPRAEYIPPHSDDQKPKRDSTQHQPNRLASMDDDPYFSYPNLFTSQDPNLGSGIHSSTDNSRSP